MDDKKLDVMSLLKDEYIVETAPKAFFNSKKLRAKRYMKLVACVAIIATVFSVSPMRSWADYIVKKLKITINFNENNVNIGDAYETKITIPEDCKEVQYDNVMYLTKAYNSIDTLESDINESFYSWQTEYKILDEALLNIVPDKYARIFFDYDIPADGEKDGISGVSEYVYIPINGKNFIKELAMENKALSYCQFDESGNIELYKQNIEYELVKQYKSKKLDTQVIVVKEKLNIKMSDNEINDSDFDELYYCYFAKSGKVYMIQCIGSLDGACRVIETMGEESQM